MKRIVDYIIEHSEDLNLADSIQYDVFAELLLYIKNNTIFADRLQAICDTFRHSYDDNLSTQKLKSSKIFNKFIDDSLEEYNKEYKQLDLNIGTRNHLCDEIAAWMLPKIKLELDKLEDTESQDD
jgi:hypothetical protein